MPSVSVSDLKATLSRYIGVVKAGEEILVTERGRPVARLVPTQGVEEAGQKKSRLVRSGILRDGAGEVPSDLLEPPRPRESSARRPVADITKATS